MALNPQSESSPLNERFDLEAVIRGLAGDLQRVRDGHWFDAQDDGAVPGKHWFCTDVSGQRGERELRFWCQRCHNRHDAASRRASAAITIHDRNAGTLDMFRGGQ